MAAEAYAEQRRAIAKRLGLGRKPKVTVAAPAPEAEPSVKAAPKAQRAPRKAAAAE